jgi:hypothetical protein
LAGFGEKAILLPLERGSAIFNGRAGFKRTGGHNHNLGSDNRDVEERERERESVRRRQ